MRAAMRLHGSSAIQRWCTTAATARVRPQGIRQPCRAPACLLAVLLMSDQAEKGCEPASSARGLAPPPVVALQTAPRSSMVKSKCRRAEEEQQKGADMGLRAHRLIQRRWRHGQGSAGPRKNGMPHASCPFLLCFYSARVLPGFSLHANPADVGAAALSLPGAASHAG